MKQGTKAVWTVDSFDWNRRIKGVTYKVSLRENGNYHCTCDAFKFGEGAHCKHIIWVVDNAVQPDEVHEPDILPMLRDALLSDKNVTLEIKHTREGTTVKIIR